MTGETKGEVVEKGANSGEEESIVVSVRLRPLNEKELARNDGCDWDCISNNTVAIKNNLSERITFPTAYTFDRVFGFDCTTKQVYDEGAKEVILSVVKGINSTIFAYGQTSSGKTYTMNGVTEYAIADIYNYIELHKEREFVLKFSAMEIYNEAVRDLLSADGTPLRLLDDPEKGTVVEKLTEEVLRDQSHLLELLSICEAQRKIGETLQNETSSRSHQILRLTIESSAREFQQARHSSALAATANFVDLAGSERVSQTLSVGTRLKEGSHINRSLLALGTVIRKLSKGTNGHVPYRDSKLTRILQNSLGGNARTAIICTLSPARSHIEQSRNTLFFASCAKEVTTNAKINVVVSDKALVKQLQRELAKMESELKTLTSKPVSHDSAVLLKEKELLIEQMDEEIRELRKQRDFAESRIESMLQSVVEDQVSRSNECLKLKGSESKVRIRNGNLNIFNSNNHQQLSQTFEESNTPKSFASPSQGWEETAIENYAKAEDRICKEVRCIKMKESRMEQNRLHVLLPIPEDKSAGNSVVSEENELSEKEGKSVTNEEELSSVVTDCSYDALKQKVQEMQKTINSLVNYYPSEVSPCSSEACMSNSRSLMLTRSRSCKAVLTTSPSFVSLNEKDTPRAVQSFWWNSHRSVRGANFGKLSRKDSNNSNLSVSFDMDDTIEFNAEETLEKKSHGRGKGFKQNHSRSNNGRHTRRLIRNDSSASILSASLEPEDTKEFDAEETNEKESLERKNGIKQHPFRSNHGHHNIKLIRNDSCVSNLSSALETHQTKEIHLQGEDFSRKERGLREKLFKLKYGAKTSKISKRHSRASVLSAPAERYHSKESDSEESVLNFVPEKNRTQYKEEVNQHTDNLEQEEEARNHSNAEHARLEGMQDRRHSNLIWPLEFEKRRQEIIELWDLCYVPLAHRSYFFLIYKGERSDSVYLEVELRRLHYLKDAFSIGSNVKKDCQILTPALSLKMLNREREMLSKQVHKKFPLKERENLYQKWGIKLKSKQRSLQLARWLWTNTKDIEHSKESALLVAKLAGFAEPGQVPKEIFGLSFLPQPINLNPFGWKYMSSKI
ncbi:kinesin-like protein KIN-7F [Humulus lupulus]|uniref:kinesin-like protein KIN-7F n=1 Tax=Humulus lupulus TaxID=3486 RepID=UPI002B409B12|nr:kinesin-like protein KIN-7F [Humulus lupulus]